jgi:hypothetical protein
MASSDVEEFDLGTTSMRLIRVGKHGPGVLQQQIESQILASRLPGFGAKIDRLKP